MNFDKEKPLQETYDTFLNLMLYDAPLDRMREYIADDVMGYGKTLDEKILDIKRLRELVIDQREQGAGAQINFYVKPIFRRVTANPEAAIFVDEIKISMIIDGTKNEIPLRFSSVFYYLDEKWMLVHLHGSVAVETEGDTWYINEWPRKNEELQLLVNEKTSELLNKNRELEIESSLERVRAVAMSMRTPDDLLNVCKTQFIELQKLGFSDIRNALIGIFNDEGGYFLDHDYSDYLGGSINKVIYNSHPIIEDYLIQIRRANDAFFELIIDKNQLNGWKEFRRRQGEQDDPRLNNINALYYYNYSISFGVVGISTFKPISEEQLGILKRFRNVFDLAYRRYNDISLAVAQAREAQIEVALERVRAIAMGMIRSDDLMDVSKALLTELNTLGFENIRNTQIDILNDDKGSFLNYEYSDYGVSGVTEVFYDSHPIVDQFVKDVRSASDAMAFSKVTGAELDEWRNHRKLTNHLPDPKLDKAKSLYYYCYSIGTGALGISTFEPISDEKLDVLKRFRNVFDLAYRRYIDITKAETQAREAQIEVALERVRSRTMAMHKSEELSETSFVLFEQLKELGEVAKQISIIIYNEKERIIELYATIYGNQWEEMGRIPFEKHFVHRNIYHAWKEKKKSLVIDLSGEELNDFNKFKMEHSAQYKSEDELPQHRWVIHNAFFSKGALVFSTHEPRPPETIQLLERFAAVFNLTYTRFNDLQQAEAQNKIIQAENERKTKELEEARQLQLSMLPKELPKLPNLDIAVYMKTATEVGGDYYDFNFDPDGTLTVAIGDATGHGMKAGIIVSMIKALFASGGSKLDMKTFFNQSSDTLKRIELGRLMMAYIMLKMRSNKLEFANAGMPPLFIHRRQSNAVEEIMLHGMPLGAIKDFPYEIKETEISTGDTLLLLSDGLPELRNKKNEQYGYTKVKNEFKSAAEKSPNEIVEHLKNSAARWIDGIEPDDDVTFIVMKVK